MNKSQYSDPKWQDRGFVNHIHHVVKDMGVDTAGAPLIEAYKVELIQKPAATSGTGGKPRNIALFRKVVKGDPAEGEWALIHMWQEGVEYDDSSAAGTVDVLPDGTVHVVMSFGKRISATALQFQPWEASVARSAFADPVHRPIDPRILALFAALPPTLTGSVVYIPAQAPPIEGGELQFADGKGGVWVLDIFHGTMRRFHRDAQGVVTELEQLAP